MIETLGVALTALATLYLGWAALAGPMRSLARAWLLLEGGSVVAAMLAGSVWSATLAAVALVSGVPLCGLMLWARVENSRGSRAD